MLSWIFLVAVVAALVIIGTAVTSRFVADHEVEPAEASTAASPAHQKGVLRANRHALLTGAVEDIRFDVVPYGYRQDQVDALLDELAALRQPAPAAPAESAPVQATPVSAAGSAEAEDARPAADPAK